jgi:hypothetical protein
MAISIRKYVDITSGVGGGASVRTRELISRVFTPNPILSPDTVYEFTALDDVLAYFPSSSAEYAYASKYFGFVSKSITQAKKISFARHANAASFASITGAKVKTTLAQFNTITAGGFSFVLDTVTIAVTGVNLTSAANFAAVAAAVQAAAITAGVTGAVVSYDAVAAKFKMQTGAGMVIALPAATPLATLLGFDTGIASNGAAVTSLTDTLTVSADTSTNFGSFTFLATLTLADHQEVGVWNTAQNVMYTYFVRVLAANESAWSAGLIDYSGVSLNLYIDATDWLIAGVAATNAAIDYTAANSTINNMYHSYDAPITVTTTARSNALDLLRVNYQGVTQPAGQQIKFYQRGTLMGLATAPTDLNVYTNETWFKDAVVASIMSLFLSATKVSANNRGAAQIRAQIISVVQTALLNGTVSVGRTFNQTQKAYINTLTADPKAFITMQQAGYWLDVRLVQITTGSGAVEWQANYTLLYAKDDVIRKVNGTHALI